MDLSSLLSGDGPSKETVTVEANGQVVVVSQPVHPARKKYVISDIHSWAQAFSVYAAALASAHSTSKEETAGLLSYMFTILQLARDLCGSQWLQYDKLYLEWATAREVQVWGEPNLPIFGQCLGSHQWATTLPPRVKPTQRPSVKSNKKRSTPYSHSAGCRLWNFEGACSRLHCRFLHTCYYYCGGDHRGPECPAGIGHNTGLH